MPSSIFLPRSAKAPDSSAMTPILMTPGSRAAVRGGTRNRAENAATEKIFFMRPPGPRRCYLTGHHEGEPGPQKCVGPGPCDPSPTELQVRFRLLERHAHGSATGERRGGPDAGRTNRQGGRVVVAGHAPDVQRPGAERVDLRNAELIARRGAVHVRQADGLVRH